MKFELEQKHVEIVFNSLILENGSTTTLEIKNKLRDLHFYATQEIVRNFVNEILESSYNKYNVSDNTKFLTYEFFELPKLYVENEESEEWTETLTYLANFAKTIYDSFSNPTQLQTDTFNAIKDLTSVSLDNTDPIENLNDSKVSNTPNNFKLLTKQQILNSNNILDPNNIGDEDWIVFDKYNKTFGVYKYNISRDKVRQLFSYFTNTKFQDTRSKRFKNFK